ncbi:hypothetical protein [Mangrovicella endophytica]|uniref:hypothetical protein n=1 Tax=Mangrovicella endophytica TaxID=2066697 RepID=UPI000C9E84E7|nr:hypothetical protein [Mangrovicella endophytica]
MDGDSRLYPRLRTRLRPGKLVSNEGGFLADCAIIDRSTRGARLRFFDDTARPEHFSLLDEVEGVMQPARLVWSAGSEAGACFTGLREVPEAAELARVSGRYYAVER